VSALKKSLKLSKKSTLDFETTDDFFKSVLGIKFYPGLEEENTYETQIQEIFNLYSFLFALSTNDLAF